ncbi:hypothetical protein BH20ACT8_BH20ACT8_15620 [soil metagenome]
MPLRCPPPGPAALGGLPRVGVGRRTLWRVFQRRRGHPWFFASAPPGDPRAGGRFDLPAPDGACYLATSKTAAALEALRDFGEGLLPEAALRRRAAAWVVAPSTAPAAVRLTAAAARGAGVTAALWAGEDRACTQAWAANLHRAGWRAAYHGVAHDPAGRLRSVSLFDRAGAHPPYDDEAWRHEVEPLDGPDVRAVLRRYGITVTRSDPELPFIALEDAGLPEGPTP